MGDRVQRRLDGRYRMAVSAHFLSDASSCDSAPSYGDRSGDTARRTIIDALSTRLDPTPVGSVGKTAVVMGSQQSRVLLRALSGPR